MLLSVSESNDSKNSQYFYPHDVYRALLPMDTYFLSILVFILFPKKCIHPCRQFKRHVWYNPQLVGRVALPFKRGLPATR